MRTVAWRPTLSTPSGPNPRVKVLTALPGVGEFTALVILAEVGGIARLLPHAGADRPRPSGAVHDPVVPLTIPEIKRLLSALLTRIWPPRACRTIGRTGGAATKPAPGYHQRTRLARDTETAQAS